MKWVNRYYNSKHLQVRVYTYENDLEFQISSRATGKTLFDMVCSSIGLQETAFFGLENYFLKTNGHMEFSNWLKMEKKICSQKLDYSPMKQLKLLLHPHYFPEDFERELIQPQTRHMFYLDVKNKLIRQQQFIHHNDHNHHNEHMNSPHTNISQLKMCRSDMLGSGGVGSTDVSARSNGGTGTASVVGTSTSVTNTTNTTASTSGVVNCSSGGKLSEEEEEEDEVGESGRNPVDLDDGGSLSKSYPPSDVAILLASLSAQAEYGDFSEADVSDDEDRMFLPGRMLQLLPSGLLMQCQLSQEVCRRFRQCYKSHKSMTREDAELAYLKIAQLYRLCGIEYFMVTDKLNCASWLGVSSEGISIFPLDNKTQPLQNYSWKSIKNVSYKERKFTIKLTCSIIDQIPDAGIGNCSSPGDIGEANHNFHDSHLYPKGRSVTGTSALTNNNPPGNAVVKSNGSNGRGVTGGGTSSSSTTITGTAKNSSSSSSCCPSHHHHQQHHHNMIGSGSCHQSSQISTPRITTPNYGIDPSIMSSISMSTHLSVPGNSSNKISNCTLPLDHLKNGGSSLNTVGGPSEGGTVTGGDSGIGGSPGCGGGGGVGVGGGGILLKGKAVTAGSSGACSGKLEVWLSGAYQAKQLIKLCRGNSDLFLKRRQPESHQMQQLRLQAQAERARRDAEEARLNRAHAERQAALQAKAVLEDKVAELEAALESCKTAGQLMAEKARYAQQEAALHEEQVAELTRCCLEQQRRQQHHQQDQQQQQHQNILSTANRNTDGSTGALVPMHSAGLLEMPALSQQQQHYSLLLGGTNSSLPSLRVTEGEMPANYIAGQPMSDFIYSPYQPHSLHLYQHQYYHRQHHQPQQQQQQQNKLKRHPGTDPVPRRIVPHLMQSVNICAAADHCSIQEIETELQREKARFGVLQSRFLAELREAYMHLETVQSPTRAGICGSSVGNGTCSCAGACGCVSTGDMSACTGSVTQNTRRSAGIGRGVIAQHSLDHPTAMTAGVAGISAEPVAQTPNSYYTTDDERRLVTAVTGSRTINEMDPVTSVAPTSHDMPTTPMSSCRGEHLGACQMSPMDMYNYYPHDINSAMLGVPVVGHGFGNKIQIPPSVASQNNMCSTEAMLLVGNHRPGGLIANEGGGNMMMHPVSYPHTHTWTNDTPMMRKRILGPLPHNYEMGGYIVNTTS